MEHLLLKAATTVATDEGTFEAVISTATIDREKDIVDPVGMVNALRKWADTGKKIPLAWNHSTKAEDQIGYIDPSSVRAMGNEVWAQGWIDQATEVGAHAWRLVKAGTLGFSFGYLALSHSPRRGGGRLLKELDVFEVTASPTPMNNDTRVVSWKALPADEDQRERAARFEREAELARLPAEAKQMTEGETTDGEPEDEDDPAELLGTMLSLAQDFIDDEPDLADAAAMREVTALLLKLAGQEAQEGPPEAPAKSAADLRRAADSVALEHTAGAAAKTRPKPVSRPVAERGKSLTELFADDEIEAALASEAQARIPQSDFPQDVKDRLAGKAQRILDEKSANGTAQAATRAVDPLRAKADALALEFASGGMSLHKPPRPAQPAPAPELIPLRDLKQRMRAEMLTALSGGPGE